MSTNWEKHRCFMYSDITTENKAIDHHELHQNSIEFHLLHRFYVYKSVISYIEESWTPQLTQVCPSSGIASPVDALTQASSAHAKTFGGDNWETTSGKPSKSIFPVGNDLVGEHQTFGAKMSPLPVTHGKITYFVWLTGLKSTKA